VDRLATRRIESEIVVLANDAFVSLERWPRKIGSFDSPPPGDRPAVEPRVPRRSLRGVRAFARWYASRGYPFRIPEGEAVYKTAISRALILYREGQFQAELYLAMPNSDAPEHCHPGVESVFIPWGGEFNSTRDGTFRDMSPYWRVPTAQGTFETFGVLSSRLDDRETHAVHVYRKGAAFLSIEKWRNDLQATSVTVNWEGEAVDGRHKNIIRPGRRSSHAPALLRSGKADRLAA
jgi:hypothetical protein